MKLVKLNWTENVHIISEMVSFISSYYIELTQEIDLLVRTMLNSLEFGCVYIFKLVIQSHKNHFTT